MASVTIYNREAALFGLFLVFSIFIYEPGSGGFGVLGLGQRRPESLRSGLDACSAWWRPVPDGFPKSAPPNPVRGLGEVLARRQQTAQEGQRP